MRAPTTGQIAHMRAAINALMPDTCNLLTVTRTSDSAGGFTESWGTAAGTVSCRLDLLAGRSAPVGFEQVVAGVQDTYTRWILTVPYDTTVTEAYRVEHGGNTYNVVAVDTDKSWRLNKRVGLEAL